MTLSPPTPALPRADDEDGRLPQSRRGSELALKTRSAGPAAPSDSSGGVLRALPVSLADLIHAGLLTPGDGVLSVAYKGSTHRASLLADGTIRHDGKVYNSASAFSIHVKRLITPDKQGDDGWKSVLYAGKPLDTYRCEVFCFWGERVLVFGLHGICQGMASLGSTARRTFAMRQR